MTAAWQPGIPSRYPQHNSRAGLPLIAALMRRRVPAREACRATPGAFCFAQAADHADQGLPYGPDADKARDAALEALEAVRAKVPAVNEGRHAHRDHDARRAALEQAALTPVAGLEGKAGPNGLLEKALEKGWHHPEPERIDNQQMIGPGDGFLGLDDGRRRLAFLPWPGPAR